MSQFAAMIKVSSGKAVEERAMDRLFSVLLVHDVKATEAQFKWSGPKIPPEEWAKMMAFFEWTYNEHKSESQVRWYVHPEHGWKCWAYEQEGNTGMTTKEHPLDTSPNKEQRLQFNESDGWLYFMTVHHHCSAQAFQSSTDENDEKKVDGIHLTIGQMDKAFRHFHGRMYLQGHKFEPGMSHFWDIGDETRSQITAMKAKLAEVENFLGNRIPVVFDEDDIAIAQMCDAEYLREFLAPSTEPGGLQFPEQWKTNYVIQPRVTFQHSSDYYLRSGPTGTAKEKWYRCVWCDTWVEDHTSETCPKKNKQVTLPQHHPQQQQVQQTISRKERRKLKQQLRESLGKSQGGDGKQHDVALATLYKDIVTQLAVLGYDDKEIDDIMETALSGQLCDGIGIVIAELLDSDGSSSAELLAVHLDKKAKEELAAMKTKTPPASDPAVDAAWQAAINEGGWGHC